MIIGGLMDLVTYDRRQLVHIHIGEEDHIVHRAGACTSCGYCVSACSMNLWIKKNNRVRLAENYKSYCLECASCFVVCKEDAVDFTFPEGGYGVVYAYE